MKNYVNLTQNKTHYTAFFVQKYFSINVNLNVMNNLIPGAFTIAKIVVKHVSENTTV